MIKHIAKEHEKTLAKVNDRIHTQLPSDAPEGNPPPLLPPTPSRNGVVAGLFLSPIGSLTPRIFYKIILDALASSFVFIYIFFRDIWVV